MNRSSSYRRPKSASQCQILTRAFQRSRISSAARSVNERPALGTDAFCTGGRHLPGGGFQRGLRPACVPPYRAEISLNLAILLTLACFVVFYTLLRTLALTLSMPRRVREFRERRRREKAAREFYDVARLIFEGRYSQALKKATGAHAAGQSPALAALLAAHSAQRLREPDKQKEWLDRAAQDDPKMQSACLMLKPKCILRCDASMKPSPF
ncbi:MAG: hypothetical protein IPI21_18160 [Propionivibrio sp.]|nr:hypothetical protein [Propionivibrio sp.]